MNTNTMSYWHVGYFDQGQFWSLGEYSSKENAEGKLRDLKNETQIRNREYCIMEKKVSWIKYTYH